MRGSLIYVMGPSGAGKDALIEIAKVTFAGLDGIEFIKRRITRGPNSGGEDFAPISQAAFDYLEANNRFFFSWRSHGLSYGCDRQVERFLAKGLVVVVNGSRAYLPKAAALSPGLKPVLITARPEILAARLKARGRESAFEQSERLNQPGYDFEGWPNIQIIDNSGELGAAAERFCSYLNEELEKAVYSN